MEARQLLIEYKDAARPLSRIQIASAFLTLEKHVDEMTRVERETYEFLKTEFNYEILKISGDAEPSETRWHIYSRDLTEGVLNFDINYSLSQMSESSQSTSTRSQGFKTYGYVFNTVGFYFNIVDNLEKGDNVNGFCHRLTRTITKESKPLSAESFRLKSLARIRFNMTK
jgi:hypothetical protein